MVARRGRALCAAVLCGWWMVAGSAHALSFDPGAGASPDAQYAASWVRDAADHQNQPFAIVDKKEARIHVFGADGILLGSSPILMGLTAGDFATPDIARRAPASLQPFERTTPAGRFASQPGHNAKGEDIVWIDYDAAVSMHRVRATNPAERRLERLATPTSADNRISYGCINVPVAFFDANVSPLYRAGRQSIVYILPEQHTLRDVFPSLLDERASASEETSSAARASR